MITTPSTTSIFPNGKTFYNIEGRCLNCGNKEILEDRSHDVKKEWFKINLGGYLVVALAWFAVISPVLVALGFFK